MTEAFDSSLCQTDKTKGTSTGGELGWSCMAFPGAGLDGSAKEINLHLWTVFAVARVAGTTRVWDAVWKQSSMQGDACWDAYIFHHSSHSWEDAWWEETRQPGAPAPRLLWHEAECQAPHMPSYLSTAGLHGPCGCVQQEPETPASLARCGRLLPATPPHFSGSWFSLFCCPGG